MGWLHQRHCMDGQPIDVVRCGEVFRSQQAGTLTARPPRLVSLYFESMSDPVSRRVRIAASRETTCCPDPRSASEAAVIAFTAPMALRSMHGT